MSDEFDIRKTRGLIATVCLSGSVKPQFAAALSDLRDWNSRNQFTSVEYRTFNGVLIEAARDGVVTHALKEGYDWILQIDADAAPFPQDSLARMLDTCYVSSPALEVLGAYAQLKAPPHFPTIDTGTGTWEEHYPGEGVLPVIRTGCHFLLTKTNVFKRFGPPWFRTRQLPTLLTSLKEIDGAARQRFHGANPLVEVPEWNMLFHEAARSPESFAGSGVGEDSGFFDSHRFHGGTAAVDTDLVIGHVADKIISPIDFMKHKDDVLQRQREALGCG